MAPVLSGVLADPAPRPAMARCAGDAALDLQGNGLLLLRHRKAVAAEARRALGRRRWQAQVAGDETRAVVEQHPPGRVVAVAALEPGEVLVLQHVEAPPRPHGAVAVAGGAGGGPDVLAGLGTRRLNPSV